MWQAIDGIVSREKYINSQYDNLVDEYRRTKESLVDVRLFPPSMNNPPAAFQDENLGMFTHFHEGCKNVPPIILFL